MNATGRTSGFLISAALAALFGTAVGCADADEGAGDRPIEQDTEALSGSGRSLAPDTRFFIPTPNPGASRQFVDLIKTGALKDALRIAALATTPHAAWFTQGTPDEVRSAVRKTMKEAK